MMIDGTDAQAPLPFAPPTFDPCDVLARLAHKKPEVIEMLAEELKKSDPNEAIVQSCQSWLEVYNIESRRAAAYMRHFINRATGDA